MSTTVYEADPPGLEEPEKHENYKASQQLLHLVIADLKSLLGRFSFFGVNSSLHVQIHISVFIINTQLISTDRYNTLTFVSPLPSETEMHYGIIIPQFFSKKLAITSPLSAIFIQK